MENHHRLTVLLLSCILWGSLSPLRAEEQIRFHQVNTKGYLVRAICRDADNIVWFGTTSGLVSLPQLMSNAPHAYHRPFKAVNMSIRKINENRQGGFWVKTLYNDVLYYNPRTNEFEEDTKKLFAEMGIHVEREYTVETDSENFWLWKDAKLYWKKKEKTKVEMLTVNADETLKAVKSASYSIYALTDKLLYTYSTGSRRSVRRSPLPEGYNMRDHLFVSNDDRPLIWAENKVWMLDNNGAWVLCAQVGTDVTGVSQDSQSRYWVSTQSDGIYLYDQKGQLITHLVYNPGKSNGLQSNYVEMIYYDESAQAMWVSYTKGGLSVYTGDGQNMLLKDIIDSLQNEINTDVLTFAPAAGQEGLLIGLEERGVYYHGKDGDKNIIGHGSAISLHTGEDGTLWVGMYRHGLIHKTSDGKEHLHFNGKSPFAIAEDRQGHLFTALLGFGVWQMDIKTGETTKMNHVPNYVFDLEYNDRKLYAASTVGLFVKQEDRDWKKLYDGHFRYLQIDRYGYIWLLGNEGSEGLTLLSPTGEKQSLPHNLEAAPLKSIAMDGDGNVWTVSSTELWMIKHCPEEKESLKCYPFTINEESQQVFYNTHTSYVDSWGILWLGTANGYQEIDTKRLRAVSKDTMQVRRLTIGAIRVNDNVLSPGQPFNGRILLEKDVMFTTHLDLRYNENNLVIECSPLWGNGMMSVPYQYQLKGLSDDWHPFEGNSIILSNLSPGDYQLYTRTQFSKENLLLTIHISAPFWLSWWAIVLYLLLMASMVYGVLHYYHNRRKYQEQVRELQRQQEQQTQMNEMKLRFFTNISHDLRTPLSLIIGPIEELLKTVESKHQPALRMIHRNANNLLSLVNQVLDFRRLEFGKEKLVLTYGDIVSVVGDTCVLFSQKAEKGHIHFSFMPNVERVNTVFDHDKTTKIMMNLLSNAFKFTEAGGTIMVKLDVTDGHILITVSDTGVGISEEDRTRIFERFYQSDDSYRTSAMGSGIGLHIVREYVHLQGGEITVDSNVKEGRGCVFSFSLPLKKSSEQVVETVGVAQPMEHHTEEEGQEEAETQEKQMLTLLLVDDNQDLLEYMSTNLSDSYHLITATNGKEALLQLQQADVDLIVSDVMMPEIDGLELCRRIKEHIETSHIPVILLTAKAMTSDELQGLQAGADDYVTKPFSMDVLRQRIYNLLERSRHLHERFAREIDIAPSEITVTSLDQQFIAHAIEIVEAHMADPDFSVEQLSDEMGVHRAQLYKKLQHLTGKSPLQFVRILRLKRGKQLLEQSGLYVSEVAYQVGFNSPRIFSKYFKEEFGVTPKDFTSRS